VDVVLVGAGIMSSTLGVTLTSTSSAPRPRGRPRWASRRARRVGVATSGGWPTTSPGVASTWVSS